MQGKSINGFILQRLLGVGGMAEVWYAENEIEKIAAVKLLLPKFSHDEAIVARFKNEAKVMVKLDHPNIRQVYGYGEIEGRPCIVMEYLDGDDLKARMKRGQRFTQSELERWWNQLVSALNYTHGKGIVHRDIKPGNIFIDKEGNLKLLDFGIAKVRESISMTQTGAMMGTLMYMSPEQVQDAKHLGPASDVYSLAVTFVHLLTGKAPYDTTTSNDFQIREGIVYKPLDITGAPAEWQEFLRPYLEKDPAKRPPLRPFGSSAKETPTVAGASVAAQPAAKAVPETDEGTVVAGEGNPQPLHQMKANKTPEPPKADKPSDGKKKGKGLWISLGVAVAAFAVVFMLRMKPKEETPVPVDPDTEALMACQTVDDYRAYIRDYGQKAVHYAEAKHYVDSLVADSVAKAEELEAQLIAQKQAEENEKAQAEADRKEDEAHDKCTTIAGCDKYLKAYPNGRYVDEVQKKKAELEQQEANERAEAAAKELLEKQRKEDEVFRNCNSLAACNQYLIEYPNGRYVNQVKVKKTNFEAELAMAQPTQPKTSQNANSGSMSTLSTAKPGFSISPSKRVYFASGNLQYRPKKNQWRFAPNPWDCIGEANSNISPNYRGWIDLFGWGTGDDPTKRSGDYYDYSVFTDWGSKMGGGWRTLTKDEWVYVFDKRGTTSGIRYAKARVNNVNGVILLPDNWSKSTHSLNNTNSSGASFGGNSISTSTWNNTFKPAGAVFLPAAGYRNGTSVSYVGSHGDYWSASPYGSDDAYHVYFGGGYLSADDWNYRYNEFSVRLACPAE